MQTVDLPLMTLVISIVIAFVTYASYIMIKMSRHFTESQERRISTLMLMMMFFGFAVIYEYFYDSHTFVALWFMYIVYHAVKEVQRITSINCDKRFTDRYPCL